MSTTPSVPSSIMETESGLPATLPPAPPAAPPTAAAPGLPDAPAAMAAPVGSIPLDKKERIMALLQGRVLNAATGTPSNKLSDTIQQHYQQRLAEARMYQQNAQLYASILATGRDPKTGQPLTPEQEAQYEAQYNAAMGQYQKSAGVDKASKDHVNKAKAFVDHVIAMGRQHRAQAGAASAGGAGGPASPAAPAGASVSAQGAAAPSSNGKVFGQPGHDDIATPAQIEAAMTPEERARMRGGLPPAPTPQASAASAPPSTLPPPPAPQASARDALAAPALQNEFNASEATQADVNKKNAEASASLTQRKQAAAEAGLQPGTAEYREFIATGHYPTGAGSQPKMITRHNSGSDLAKSYPGITTIDGQPLDPSQDYDLFKQPVTGEFFATPSGKTAGQMAAPKGIGAVGGPPVGIIRDGKFMQPGDPGWSDKDAKELAALQASYNAGDEAKNRRVALSARVRADAYAKSRILSVVDKDSKELDLVSAYDINRNPGKYTGSAPGMQTLNRAAIFGDIDYATQQMNEAIDKMGDEAFDASSRAQISAVLRSTDPNSALSSFLNSTAATTLSDAQVEYVTAMVNMQESALSLRNVAGLGQGSDLLRHAIGAMLPNAGTPSKTYAKRQMQLFQGEVGQLRKSVPGMGKSVASGLPNAPAAAAAAPARPDNVPPDYVFLPDGPKGRGWYKPGTTGTGKGK